MLLFLFIAFTLFSIIELKILITIGGIFSGMSVLVLVLVTGYMGAYLLKNQGRLQMKKFESLDISEGVDILLVETFFMLVAAVLLICPGLITDFVGLLLIFPLSRRIFANLFAKYAKKYIEKLKGNSRFQVYNSWEQKKHYRDKNIADDEKIIDIE